MSTQKETFQFESEVRQAKLRSSQRHKDGWRPIHTDHKNNQWEIIWTNDPEPEPPTKRKLTQRQLLNEIANERNIELV